MDINVYLHKTNSCISSAMQKSIKISFGINTQKHVKHTSYISSIGGDSLLYYLHTSYISSIRLDVFLYYLHTSYISSIGEVIFLYYLHTTYISSIRLDVLYYLHSHIKWLSWLWCSTFGTECDYLSCCLMSHSITH